MTRRVWPWIALAVLVVGIVVVLAFPGGDATRADRVRSITAELKCQECQGLSVADSHAPTSEAIRDDVERRVAAGESDAEIRQYFVDQYGEGILLQPQSSGISLLVWILPVVVVSVGAAGLLFVLARNRSEPRLHATAADELLVERARDRGAGDVSGGGS